MSSRIGVKICGLREPKHVDAAAKSGAAYIGLVFFEKSPRHVTIEQAHALSAQAPPGVAKVGLAVNPSDAFLDELMARVPLDLIQLHGQEPAERVVQIRARLGLPVMKAVGIACADDLLKLDTYMKVADQVLVDAKPSAEGELPGGNGLSFDWRLIAARRWPVPWMLAGGLSPDNVAQAVALTGAQQVDVSSGVECAPGVKDPRLIRDFIASAQGMPAFPAA
ncbi:MAG: phosphoribosylanthranilate isomerase [Pseudomonadota bacterium]